MSDKETTGEQEQQPASMTRGDSMPNYIVKYRFANWVRYLVSDQEKKRRKSIFGKSKNKYTDIFLKFHKTGRFDLYKSDAETGEKPFEQYSIKEGSFKKTDKKNYKVVCDVRELLTHKKVKLHISFLNNLHYSNLCRWMVKTGAEELDKAKPKELTRISNSSIKMFFSKSVKDWKTHEIIEWSKCVIVSDDFRDTLFDIAGKLLEKDGLKGVDILKWKKKDILQFCEKFGIRSFRGKNRFKREILKLQTNPFFDPLKNIVMGKVVKMLDKQKQSKNNGIIQRFTKAFASSQVMYANMKSILYPNNEDVKKAKLFRVKLIIVENMQDDRLKRFRSLFGRVLEVKDFFDISDDTTKYGLFHASLSIGPLQFEWVDSSLSIIRPVCSEKVILCVDVDNLEVTDGDKMMKKLVKECLRWNREYYYESFSIQKNQKYANCQHFVNHMIGFLNIEYNPGKHIRSFLKRMKHRGVAEMVFQFDRRFAKKFFPSTGNSMSLELRPKSHRELDLFVQKLFRVCPTFERDYQSQYELLKGFDRAFWMKYLKDRKNSDYEPMKRSNEKEWGEERSGCPFCPPAKLKKTSLDERESEDETEGEGEGEGEEDLPLEIKELRDMMLEKDGMGQDVVSNLLKLAANGDESFDLRSVGSGKKEIASALEKMSPNEKSRKERGKKKRAQYFKSRNKSKFNEIEKSIKGDLQEEEEEEEFEVDSDDIINEQDEN